MFHTHIRTAPLKISARKTFLKTTKTVWHSISVFSKRFIKFKHISLLTNVRVIQMRKRTRSMYSPGNIFHPSHKPFNSSQVIQEQEWNKMKYRGQFIPSLTFCIYLFKEGNKSS